MALLNYPDVLSMMNRDLDWTQQLGNAVVAQQADVLNAIQAFRKKAYDAGNLKSNDKQSVKVENQAVIVQSADPQTFPRLLFPYPDCSGTACSRRRARLFASGREDDGRICDHRLAGKRRDDISGGAGREGIAAGFWAGDTIGC